MTVVSVGDNMTRKTLTELEAYQLRALRLVSRTFALTIPQLPAPLRRVVGNFYLLCRIADTVEDATEIDGDTKAQYQQRFLEVMRGQTDPQGFAKEVAPRLGQSVSKDERELVAKTSDVIAVTNTFQTDARSAIENCINIMSEGMARFGRVAGPGGLRDIAELREYCYHVAGVVGETLTTLFCLSSRKISKRKMQLEQFAVSFGIGLQMTNILKDVWDDMRRGVCWLPRDVFAKRGVDIAGLPDGQKTPEFSDALGELIAVGHAHLKDAMAYTLTIPRSEAGIRRFCLWAILMATMTLKKLDKNRDYTLSETVKISRRAVRAVVWGGGVVAPSDWLSRLVFSMASWGLPKGKPSPEPGKGLRERAEGKG